MLNAQTIASVVILTPDVVRMNAQREQVIVNFIDSPLGKACNAFGKKNADGHTSVELWSGDEVQHQVFKKTLEHELFA